jgi:YggT family protein
MDVILLPLFWLIDTALALYLWIVIAAVVLSWLVSFNIVNPNNNFVHIVGDFLYRMTEPVFMRIRRILPAMGGIDLSPIVVFLGIGAIRMFIGLVSVKLFAAGAGVH